LSKASSLSEADVTFIRSRLIHEDDLVLAFDKPAGLSSQGGRIAALTLDDLLAAFERSGGNRPRLVHRLDRDTSGVILAAKTKPAAAFLGRALMTRKVKKTYLALIAPGAPQPPFGRITTPLRREVIGRDVRMTPCAADHPDAEETDTGYRTLAESPEAALVELRPHTGRMHQLRAHMASIGRPIAGDVRYGGALMLGGAPVPRLMLHAAALEAPHPAGGRLQVTAPPPADFQETAVRLGLLSRWPLTYGGGRAQ